jgi:hypothetical protein
MTVEAEETTADVIIPCPGCGSNNTHIRMIKRPKKKKSCPSSRTVRIGRTLWIDARWRENTAFNKTHKGNETLVMGAS